MKCPNCGYENPDTANFCVHCGTSLKNALEEEKKTSSEEKQPQPEKVIVEVQEAPRAEKKEAASSPLAEKLAKASIITGACVISSPCGVGLGAAALALSKNKDEKKKALIGLILSSVLSVGVIVGAVFASQGLSAWVKDHVASDGYFTSFNYEESATYTIDETSFLSALDGAHSPKVQVISNHHGRNYFTDATSESTTYDNNSAAITKTILWGSSTTNRYLSLNNNVLTSYSKQNGSWVSETSSYAYQSIHAGVFELRYHQDDASSFYKSCSFDSEKKAYTYEEKERSDATLDSDYSNYSLKYTLFFKNSRLFNIRYYYTYTSTDLTFHIYDETLFSSYDTAAVTFPSDMPIE